MVYYKGVLFVSFEFGDDPFIYLSKYGKKIYANSCITLDELLILDKTFNK